MSDETRSLQEDDEERKAPAGSASSSKASPGGTRGPEEEIARLRRENEELLTKLKYLQAESENARKRAEREAEAVVKFGQEVLLARLIPVLDEMDAAVAALDGKAAAGVRMVRDNFLKALRDAGVQEIAAEGLAFDPYVMDCVDQVTDPAAKDGTVTKVVQKGYRLHDRILRPAQVVVVKDRGETNG